MGSNNNIGFCSMNEKNKFLLNTLCKSTNGLHICHINAQSLVNKFDEFKMIFEDSLIDIVCVSETWFNPNLNSNLFSLKGFKKPYRADRIRTTGGGVAIFVKNYIRSCHVKCSDGTDSCDYYFIDIFEGDNKCSVGTIYMPPRMASSRMITPIVEEMCSRVPNLFICGDLNINLFQPSSNCFKTSINSLGLSFINNTEPTHFFPNCAPSLIDVFLTSDENFVKCYSQLSVPVFSYHDLIFSTLDLNFDKKSQHSFQYRDFRNINLENLFNECMSMDFHSMYTTSNVNYQIEYFTSVIKDLFNKHVTLKTFNMKSRSCPWLSADILNAIKARDVSYRRWRRFGCPEMLLDFKRLRNSVTNLIKIAKYRFYNNKFNSDRSSKFFWKEVKNIGLRKDVQSCDDNIDLEGLNVKFSTSQTQFCEMSSRRAENDTTNAFSVSAVDDYQVGKAIFSIKSKCTGLDNIHPDFIKILLPFLLSHITHIFNTIIMTSTYPILWKTSKIIPILKQGKKKEYRPIAILSFLSKVFESLISNQIKYYIKDKQLLNPLQSGFRSGHSCVSALLNVSDDIRHALDNKFTTVITLLDFSKAFDCVNHNLLCDKLTTLFSFSDTTKKLIYSYLTNRMQAVSCNGRMSSFLPVNNGVPQGSILGPLLFSLFINDLPSVLSYCQFHIYADDVQLYISFPEIMLRDAISKMNIDLQAIYDWSTRNGLKLNPEKTKALPISINKPNPDNFPPVMLNNCIIEYVAQVRNLGLVFNNRLTWNNHVDTVVSKIYASLRGLSVTKSVLPTHIKLKLVKALVLPIITYGCELFADLDSQSAHKLKVAFNAIARFVFNLRRFDHVSFQARQLFNCDLVAFFKYRCCILLFKLIVKKTPSYLCDRLNFCVSSRSILLRSSTFTCLTSRRQFFVHAVRLWNNLPSHMRSRIESRKFQAICFEYFSNLN